MADKLPRGSLRAATQAVMTAAADFGHDGLIAGDAESLARAALEGALPLIERDVQRKMARHLMALRDAEQCPMTHSSWRRCLRRISRGEPLPDLSDVTATPGSDRPS